MFDASKKYDVVLWIAAKSYKEICGGCWRIDGSHGSCTFLLFSQQGVQLGLDAHQALLELHLAKYHQDPCARLQQEDIGDSRRSGIGKGFH